MNPPLLTHEQRELARDTALQARKARSVIKDAVRSGRLSPVDVLTSTDPVQRAMRVSELLRSMPNVGPVRCASIMEQIKIAPSRRIGGLSPRQLQDLIRVLDGGRDGQMAVTDGS